MFEFRIETIEKSLDWLQWSASIISSIAWPVAIVVIVWIFHSQISGMLSKIKKLSWGDKIVDFSEQLDKIEEVSLAATTVSNDYEIQAPMPDARFQQLLSISPSAAILDSWGPIEVRLRNLEKIYRDRENIPSTSLSPRRTIEFIYNKGLIEHGVFELLIDLQRLRNAAAHQEDVTPTDAIRFQALAEKAMRELDRLRS